MERQRVILVDTDVLVDIPCVYAAYRLSHNAGVLDVLIGQTAVAVCAPLHTFNQRHYAFIPGLTTVQPYVKVA